MLPTEKENNTENIQKQPNNITSAISRNRRKISSLTSRKKSERVVPIDFSSSANLAIIEQLSPPVKASILWRMEDNALEFFFQSTNLTGNLMLVLQGNAFSYKKWWNQGD